MLSTSTKIAFGYIILIGLLFGAIGYIYKQMELLTSPTGFEKNIENRRRTTHEIISQLYKAEIIGQTLRVGELNEYPAYKRAMRNVGKSIDSLQTMLTDTLQQARLDTVRILVKNKERNMRLVLEALGQPPTDELYKQQIDSLIAQQDSLLNSTHIRRKVITHRNTYTIHHKPKKFFKRLADLFSPGKADSTQVNNVIQEEYTDTIDEAYNPVDTLAGMLSNIQHRVFQTRQEQLRTVEKRIYRLRIAGSKLSQRVNQLLETIEDEEQKVAAYKFETEQRIREQAAWTMATIAILAVLVILIFFIIICRDITRSNHYRKELEKAKSYAENLLVAREKLMLTITHDIKAPTGSIIGYIDLLIRLVKDKRQLFYLDNMKSSAQHLLDLVTSLLDYHRLEAGKMDLHPVAFNPHQLFETIYTSFLPLAEKKNLKLEFADEFKPGLTLEGDPFRIRQIVENLLSNALKFTKEGSITLHAKYQGNQFIFSVTDTGCGMTPQEQERVFQAFIRLRSAQGQEGFGLGLSITQKLVELLQGKIAIESTLEKGSTFRVSMPLPSISASSKNKEQHLVPVKPLRILLIDDDRIQMNLTEAMLRNILDPQTTIQCCEQPEDLFGFISQQPFDILFTDIQMPAMNGFELLENLRKLPVKQAQNIPVIAITARSDMDESHFQEKGFAGCLHKPFNQSDLLQILQQFSVSLNRQIPEKSTEKVSTSASKYNFSPLTAFSADDTNAAQEIIKIFIQETQKSTGLLQEALSRNDIQTISAIAHKLLPTLTMIEAKEIVPSLQQLESRKGAEQITDEDIKQTKWIIQQVTCILEEAEKYVKKISLHQC